MPADAVGHLCGLLAALTAAVCCAGAARRDGSGRPHPAWALLAVSAMCGAAGEATLGVISLRGERPPVPSLADAGFLLAVPSAVVAVVLLAGHDRIIWRVRSVVDGLVAATTLLSVGWVTVLGPAYRAGDAGPLAAGIGIGEALGDVVVATMLVSLLCRARREDRRTFLLLTGGLVAATLGDAAVALSALGSAARPAALAEAGWVVGHALIAFAALRAWTVAPAPVAESPPPPLNRHLRRYLPLVVAVVVAIDQEMHGRGSDRVLLITLIVLPVLVTAREVLSLREGAAAGRTPAAWSLQPGDGPIRQWLARELHDDALQKLTIVLIQMEEMRRELSEAEVRERVADFQASVRSAIGGLRRLLGDLREQPGDDHRLVADLTALVGALDSHAGIRGRVSVSPSWPPAVSAHIASNVRRIAEEALRNVALHSGAQNVTVSLDTQEEVLTLTVSDDGRGCLPSGQGCPEGTGMMGMRERALILGGRLDVTCGPGGGTTVRSTFARSA